MLEPPSIRAAAHPDSLRICGEGAPLELLADGQSGDGTPKLKRFSMVAYTGTAMNVGFSWPVVVDLEGINVPSQGRPILRDHDFTQIVGHSETVDVSPQRIKVAGVMSGVGEAALETLALAKNGFPFQASIGASIQQMEYVDRGESVKVNGRNFSGPVYVARKTTLGEISFVPVGADGSTSASVAASTQTAQAGGTMNFNDWLKANGFDPATISDGQKKILKAAFDAEIAAANPPVPPPPPPPPPQPVPAPAPPDVTATAVQEYRRTMAAETDRVSRIRQIAAAAGNPTMEVGETGNRHREAIEALAIRDGWDTTRAELETLRASRAHVGNGFNTPNPETTFEVLAAAIGLTGKIHNPEKHYSAQALEAASRQYRRGITPQEFLHAAAVANGYSSRNSVRNDLQGVLRAAFSTMVVSNILSNNMNKFLLQGYTSVNQAWKQLAATGTAKDFKTMTSYRLLGSFKFEKVGPDGELKHDLLGEESFTNKVETYGKMFGIPRQKLIDDDLGAFTDIPLRIGRGAALKVNDVFWTEFLADHATFFTAGRGNYIVGAGTVLSSASLATAYTALLKQIDPDGNPINLEMIYLVVPPELAVTAMELYQSTNVNTGGSSNETKVPNKNIWAGRFLPVVVPYLSNASYTGFSTTAWYLIASPNEYPIIEALFLNGQQEPIVETAEADFNTLGIETRGYFDFGIKKQDYRGALKSKGAA